MTFWSSSLLVAGMGGQYTNPDLGAAIGDQLTSGTAFAAGEAALEALGGCDSPAAEPVAEAIVDYVEARAEGSGFVEGCTRRWSRAQCECLAGVGRAVIPGIDEAASIPPSSAGSSRAIRFSAFRS